MSGGPAQERGPEGAWRGGTYGRYRQAIQGEPLPTAMVDLDALDENTDRIIEMVRSQDKRLRLATKSLRCPDLLSYLLERGAGAFQGLMTYSAAETAFLYRGGFDDLLLAYPTVHPADLSLLCGIIQDGATAAVVVDSAEQMEPLERVAEERGVRVPVVIEIDMSYRPTGRGLHLGVRRSPLRTAGEAVELAQRAADSRGLAFGGIMAYEAQIAGLPDHDRSSSWMTGPRRLLKRLSRRTVERTRAELASTLADAGLDPPLFNGGGTGSLSWCTAEAALTEVTAGSGFLGSHLFDHYNDIQVTPASFFAVQVVRRPAPGIVTCHGGGLVASGGAGPDRLPIVAHPAGLELLRLEGAGEVQTPLRVPAGVDLAPGDPIFMRHAKAGELAEHFNEYLLVRGDQIEGRAPTYRGLGQCFLG